MRRRAASIRWLPLVLLCACAGDLPRASTMLRPIDEPLAVAIMARVFREMGLEPVRNRAMKFGASNAPITLDIAARGRRFGIAYVTSQDADALAEAIPARRDPEAIWVIHGAAEDADVHAAVLFAADYLQDDLAGEQHTITAIAAETRLELATRDILRRAAHENWP